MKLTALLTILFCLFVEFIHAQQKKIFVVKAGEVITQSIPFVEMYSYPSFMNGMVYFRSGESSTGLLNYNILTSEMDFVDANGDTLALADEPLVKMIVIAKDTFFFNNGYFKLVTSSSQFKLGKRDVFTTAKIEKTGAYDQPMPAGIDTYDGLSNGNHVAKLVVKQNITLVKEAAYYFGNKNNEFLPANRKNLMKSFPKQEKELQKYLSAHEVNFTNEEDLVKMVSFLQSL
jgi:hypothetical protein